MIAVWRLALRRSLSNWRLLAVVSLGVVAAATLLASAPIYARAMADLGLTFTIRDELRASPATRTEFRDIPLGTEDGRALRAAVERRIDERIGWFRAEQTTHLRLGRFVVLRAGEEQGMRTPLIQPQSLPGYQNHIRLIEGQLPRATGPGEPLQLAISSRSAQVSNLRVGLPVELLEDFDTCERELPRDDRPPPPPCNPRAGLTFSLPAVVTAIVEPVDPEDPFWLTGVRGYFEPERLIPDAGPIMPAFADQDAVLGGFAALLPRYRAATAWHTTAEPERLTRENFERARADLRALYQELQPLGGFAFSPLGSTLDSFGRSARYQQTPLTILLLEIAGVALFYVALVSAVVVERQADEITLLRSRGASTTQVAGIYFLEGAIIGVAAILVAPFLAAAVTALLGLTPTFERVTDGELLPVTIQPSSFLLATLGALLAVLALTLPAFVVARRSAAVNRRGQARPAASLFHRYYLDLVVVAFAALLLWEIRERGSVFQPSATGGVASDPLLLAAPALIIVAAALLVLRFYPLLLRWVSALVSRPAGVTVAVGLWQVVRRPGQYTRLALLLMMAVAIGTFAASYASTAERSYRDRAAYEVGVDMRAGAGGDIAFSGTTAELEQSLAALPGVERASAVLRASGRLATPGGSQREVQLLAVDPAVAGEMLWFREDFAARPLAELVGELAGPDAVRGRPLPGTPTMIGAWVDPGEGRDNITLWARVRDAAGTHTLLELGKLDFQGWRQLRVPIQATYGPRLQPPFTLTALVLTEPPNVVNTSNAPVFIDDVSVVDASGRETPVEDFEGSVEWAALPSQQTIQDAFRITSDRPHGGRSSGRLAFRTGPSGGVRGIYVQDPVVPLPALVSTSFVGSTGLGPGSRALIQAGDALVPIQIKDTFDLFPTLPVREGPAVIMQRDLLTSWANSFVDSRLRGPNEVWLTLAPDADREALVKTLAGPEYRLGTAQDRGRALLSIERNPLIAAGGSGILLVAFIAVLVLVGAALLLSLWMAVQRRRVEFAVMRALGLSKGQVLRMLAFEYALVVVLGVVVGVVLGLIVGREMLSFLNVTETGGRVVPPFILQTRWSIVAVGVAGVLLIFGGALAFAVRVLAGTSDAQALRTE